MELRDIEYFAIVAEHGHLGRAAEALGLSQPALSKSLRRLEKAMQAKLVARTPKGVELTAEGSVLLAHVLPLRLSLQDVARKIAHLGQGRAGHLRLGSAPGAADYLLPTAFGTLVSDAPDVTVSVTVEPEPVIVAALRNGQLDLMVTLLQTRDHAADRHRDAIDFGRVGFGDHRNAQRFTPGRQSLADDRPAIHGAQNAAP